MDEVIDGVTAAFEALSNRWRDADNFNERLTAEQVMKLRLLATMCGTWKEHILKEHITTSV